MIDSSERLPTNQFREVITAQLQKVPFLQFEFLEADPSLDVQPRYDSLLRLRLPSSDVLVAVIQKKSGEIGSARQAALDLQAWRNQFFHTSSSPFFSMPYGMFVAPYISPKSATLCRELGIGYCDFAGNCFLSFGQVYIDSSNWPNPAKRTEPKFSMWAPKAQRVLRVLLENPGQAWNTERLAKESEVSTGLISKVRGQLSEREWIQEGENGFTLKEPWELLSDWASAYKKREQTVHLFYCRDEISAIENKLAEWSQPLTEFSGAARLAPYARYTQVAAYLVGDMAEGLDFIAAGYGFERVDSGANVKLIEPYDAGVFYGRMMSLPHLLVSPTQLYLDLRAAGGRGNDAAQHLLETVLKPRWERAKML